MTCSDGHTGSAELPLAVKAAWLDVARRLCNQTCPTVDEVKKVAVAVRGGGDVMAVPPQLHPHTRQRHPSV